MKDGENCIVYVLKDNRAYTVTVDKSSFHSGLREGFSSDDIAR